MRLSRRLFERYIISAIVPYICLALLLLTVILLVQQASHFAEILGTSDAPLSILARVLVGLIPNVLVFTIPMATLIGTATGLSRLGGDSEIIAMRAAGVGTWRIASPVLGLGIGLSLLSVYIGFKVAPAAFQRVRHEASRAALAKFDSPVTPRVFNTDIPGKMIYVRDGDASSGQWGRVFMYWREADETTRLITARSGRIDTSGEQSELVLSDAIVTTLPVSPQRIGDTSAQIVTEKAAQLRVRLNTGRTALLRELQNRRPEPDEMNWRELLEKRRTAQGTVRRDVLISLHKRLALCCAPLAFALLGVGLGARAKRRGRGAGLVISLMSLLIYYLLFLAGEQLSRAGILSPTRGLWLATLSALVVGCILLLTFNRESSLILPRLLGASPVASKAKRRKRSKARRTLLLGMLDRWLLRDLAINFAVAFVALLAIFLIFTVFELLRFINLDGAKLSLLGHYLFYLIPFACESLLPISVLVATLMTYALLSWRSESIAWWASGQSLYRLAVPCLLFSISIGGSLWLLQESVLPIANRRQESFRERIRGGTVRGGSPAGEQWISVGEGRHLYSYWYGAGVQTLRLPVSYEFDATATHLQRLVAGQVGRWEGDGKLCLAAAKTVELSPSVAAGAPSPERCLAEAQALFKPNLNTPREMDFAALSAYIKTLKGRELSEVAPFLIARDRMLADPFAPIIMAIAALPLAINFGRRSATTALFLSIVIGLLFWGSTSGFQQLGVNGRLPPAISVWAPLLIFASLGSYLFFRART